MFKKLSTFVQLELYQDILNEKPVLDFLELHQLKKEDLFSTPYYNELKLIRKYLKNPNEKTKLSLLRNTNFKIKEPKNLLFFYLLDKGLLSFSIGENLGLENFSSHLQYEFLKTPRNTFESLFSEVFMDYLEEFNHEDNKNYLTDEKIKWRSYLLNCFNIACNYIKANEKEIISKHQSYYWQSINMFYQAQYSQEMNEKIILPLIKNGLSLDYLKNPTFTQMANFMDHIDSIWACIEKHHIVNEKSNLEQVLNVGFYSKKKVKI